MVLCRRELLVLGRVVLGLKRSLALGLLLTSCMLLGRGTGQGGRVGIGMEEEVTVGPCRHVAIGVHLGVEVAMGLLSMNGQMENLFSHDPGQRLTTHSGFFLMSLHEKLAKFVINFLPTGGGGENHGAFSGVVLEATSHTKGSNLIDHGGGDTARRRVGVVGMKRGGVEDERDSAMLFDCLREVRARRSPMFGKLEEMATAEGALALIVVNGRNETGFLGWGEMVGFHSLVRLAVVFSLFLLLGLGSLFNFLEFFLLLVPVDPTPSRLLHAP